MSKVVKGVTGAIGKVAGGLTGGLLGGGGSTGALGTGRFTGTTRKIDKSAFQLGKGTETELKTQAAKEREKRGEVADVRKGLASQLQAQAAGTAPSLAEAQMRAAQDRSLAQQVAAAQAQRGGSTAATQRQLLQGQQQAARETAQDAATTRLQEQQAAQQMLGQVTARDQQLLASLEQDYMAKGLNAQAARQQALQDFEKMETAQFLQAQGLTAQGFEGAAQRRADFSGGILSGIGGLMGLGSSSDKRSKQNIKKTKDKDFAMALSDDDVKKNKYKTPKSITKSRDKLLKTADKVTEKDKDKDSFQKKLGESFKSAGEGLKKKSQPFSINRGSSFNSLMAELSDKDTKKEYSDENTKTAYSDKSIKKDFLDKLQAYSYEYKDEFKDNPLAGDGRYVSVMAQDLEKAGPLGQSMVKEDEDGNKMVDYGKGFGAILAAQAHLNKRLDELEKKRSKKRK